LARIAIGILWGGISGRAEYFKFCCFFPLTVGAAIIFMVVVEPNSQPRVVPIAGAII